LGSDSKEVIQLYKALKDVIEANKPETSIPELLS
jgi:hypothetical protein